MSISIVATHWLEVWDARGRDFGSCDIILGYESGSKRRWMIMPGIDDTFVLGADEGWMSSGAESSDDARKKTTVWIKLYDKEIYADITMMIELNGLPTGWGSNFCRGTTSFKGNGNVVTRQGRVIEAKYRISGAFKCEEGEAA